MTCYMFNFNFFVFLISLAVLIHARDSPSTLPAAYTCPPQDALGFALEVNHENTNPIFCSYPAVSGENPNDFFCTYSMTTGALVEDNDAGLCPSTAIAPSGKSRNRDKAHAPLPTRPKNLVRGIPDAGAHKAYLKKRHSSANVVSC